MRRQLSWRVIPSMMGFVFVAAACSHAVNLDSLLVQSVGGPQAVERLRSLRSYHVAGRVSIAGQPGRFDVRYLFPNMARSDLTFGAMTIVEAYDGAVAWTKDQNGSVSEISGYQKRELTEAVWMQSYSFLFSDRHPGGVEYLGMTQRDGRRYHLVAFYPFHEDTIRIYLDSATARGVVNRQDRQSGVSHTVRRLSTGRGGPGAVSRNHRAD